MSTRGVYHLHVMFEERIPESVEKALSGVAIMAPFSPKALELPLYEGKYRNALKSLFQTLREHSFTRLRDLPFIRVLGTLRKDWTADNQDWVAATIAGDDVVPSLNDPAEYTYSKPPTCWEYLKEGITIDLARQPKGLLVESKGGYLAADRFVRFLSQFSTIDDIGKVHVRGKPLKGWNRVAVRNRASVLGSDSFLEPTRCGSCGGTIRFRFGAFLARTAEPVSGGLFEDRHGYSHDDGHHPLVLGLDHVADICRIFKSERELFVPVLSSAAFPSQALREAREIARRVRAASSGQS